MLQIVNVLIIRFVQKLMVVYFVIFQILPTFVYELFETMQSSVTRSRTFITKSLPASFQTLYIHFIFRELQQNTLFLKVKQSLILVDSTSLPSL